MGYGGDRQQMRRRLKSQRRASNAGDGLALGVGCFLILVWVAGVLLSLGLVAAAIHYLVTH